MRNLFIAAALAVLLAGCASEPKTNDFGVIENQTTTVKAAGPEETWANFAGAVDKNRADVVADLLKAGVSPNTLVADGDPALVRAMRWGNQPVIEVLLAAPGIDVNLESRLGENALMMAALRGDQKMAERLVAMGAKVNKSGWTPLHYAATEGHVEIMQWLLDLGADVNVQTRAGVTPLYMAARKPSRQAVMLLLKHGAYRDLCTERGESPATAATRAGDKELGDYLAVEKCVKPKAKVYSEALPSAADGKARMLIHLEPVKQPAKK